MWAIAYYVAFPEEKQQMFQIIQEPRGEHSNEHILKTLLEDERQSTQKMDGESLARGVALSMETI